ncbi:class I SAM-dependent methyltransferase [Pseudomonas sp. ML96]|uniref:class I SAM-dependent methyltransferase n=1 Tax=Pseudomonas sp. ML96 TaxID=1523503 RepID=UPI0005BABE77|nr:class I SAM-dependent methyltransferase [Pseudomonas sp. ML96]
MNKLIEGKTRVYFCDGCSHLQTNELPNLVEYYAQEYEINTASEDIDQLYKVVDGKLVYRAEHQAATLLSKVDFPVGARVLDYGCAKSPTLRNVLSARPDIEPFLFDVTDRYIPSWKTFPKMPQWSTHTPSAEWAGSMDVVLSFYALEHVAMLYQAIENIKALLKEGGTFYFIVPNVYQNLADFVVADHVNHFSAGSLIRLLELHGFGDVAVDDGCHDAAFVVTARLLAAPSNTLTQVSNFDKLRVAAQRMADYWQGITARIQQFEKDAGGGQVAVYGAGFYGSFIYSSLVNPTNVVCFIDRNKHLEGTLLNEKSIYAPEQMPHTVSHVLVGMNPRVAKANIAEIEGWQERSLSFFFL